MLSIPDMAILGAAALLFFGPEQLPRVARKAGNVMREIQNTSQSFIREMERAADVQEAASKVEPPPYEPAAYDPVPYDVTAHERGAVETVAEPYPAEPYPPEPVHDARNGVPHPAPAYEPPAPDPETPVRRRAAGLQSAPAEPAPETDHPAHL
jgi:sec-independent protein translocase protein TatA